MSSKKLPPAQEPVAAEPSAGSPGRIDLPGEVRPTPEGAPVPDLGPLTEFEGESATDSGSTEPNADNSGSKFDPGANTSAQLPADQIAADAKAISQALAIAGSRLPPAATARARSQLTKIGERSVLSGWHTVVALAGSTGSGKSSLFNALTELEIAAVGATRPTTSAVTSCTWGADGAEELLAWLGVPYRYRVRHESPLEIGDNELNGLVLLDLPDHDSTEDRHRDEADRILDLVDVFLWVTDPQKYADAALHRRYLQPLAAQRGVTIVVLNQRDRLSARELAACKADLARLMVADGLTDVEIIATSATEGTGVPDLVQRLAEIVQERGAWRERLITDLLEIRQALRVGLADSEAPFGDGWSGLSPDDAAAGLVPQVIEAVGIPAATRRTEDTFVRQAMAEAGWPPLRWVIRGVRPNNDSRAFLGRQGGDADVIAEVHAAQREVQLGAAEPLATDRSAIDLITGDLIDRAIVGLPDPWAASVRAVATDAATAVCTALDDVVADAVVDAEPPEAPSSWWSVAGGLQWALLAVAAVGFGWGLVSVLMGIGPLSSPKVPAIGPISIPIIMCVGALILGAIFGAALVPLAERAGQRRSVRLAEQLTSAVDAVAREQLLRPVREVLEQHRGTRQVLDQRSLT